APGLDLEVRVAERRGQLEVHDAAGPAALGPGRRPDRDVAEALAFLDARGQQIPGEDPLDGLIEPDVECDADGVGVLAEVAEASRQWHDRLLGKDQPYSEFGRYLAAVHRQANLNSLGHRALGPRTVLADDTRSIVPVGACESGRPAR